MHSADILPAGPQAVCITLWNLGTVLRMVLCACQLCNWNREHTSAPIPQLQACADLILLLLSSLQGPCLCMWSSCHKG